MSLGLVNILKIYLEAVSMCLRVVRNVRGLHVSMSLGVGMIRCMLYVRLFECPPNLV